MKAPQRHTPPPPTKYAPAIAGQPKSAAKAVRPVPPPPTRFGPPSPAAQPKSAARADIAPPPVRYGGPGQAKVSARPRMPGSSTVQRSKDTNDEEQKALITLESGKFKSYGSIETEKKIEKKHMSHIEKYGKIYARNLVSNSYVPSFLNDFSNYMLDYKPDRSGVLANIRKDFSVGTADEYDLLTESQFRKRFKELTEQSIDNQHGDGATFCPWNFGLSKDVKPFLFVSDKVVDDDIKKNAYGHILSTLRHEYRHLQQCRSKNFKERYSRNQNLDKETISLNANTGEFEAYFTELKAAYYEIAEDTGHRPDNKVIVDAINLAHRHFNNMGERRKDLKYSVPGKIVEELYQFTDKIDGIDKHLVEIFDENNK